MYGCRTTRSHAGRTGRPVERSHQLRRASGDSPDGVGVGSVVLGDEVGDGVHAPVGGLTQARAVAMSPASAAIQAGASSRRLTRIG
jgi:hypothetical protein